MNKVNKEEIFERWKPLLEKVGIPKEKMEWMAQYAEMHQAMENGETPTNPIISKDEPFLPLAMNVLKKMDELGVDLVPKTNKDEEE